MVFFTCNGCGESLKKNKVDKHASGCRNCEYLTCIDCSKDFWGDDYKSHTSCISEVEKYSASGFKAKPNKGEEKQKDWIKRIEQASVSCGSSNPKVKELLEKLQEYSNIPRKRGKFLNFLKNSLKIRDSKLTEDVWEIFSSANKPAVLETKENVKSIEEEPLQKKKSKKRKHEENGEETAAKKSYVETEDQDENLTVQTENAKKFPWNKTIRLCLKNSPDKEMSIKKLRKKVLAEYSTYEADQRIKSENDLKVLFLKKVNKNPKFIVAKDRVRLK
uniref:Cell growth-regulating nucleolar protein n=1 Tax=Phallusia mammillata TaxID=59560 RepID=A0A6F9DK46_9ASCI|nr:cell growth-regulating nucleolar protein-like [Phallusia mammillata]